MYDALGSLEPSFGDKQNSPPILSLFLQALTPFPALSLKPWADLELLCTSGLFRTPDHHSSLPWDTHLAPLSPSLNAVISKAGLSPLYVPLPQPSWSFLTASISTRMTHQAPYSITSLASYGQRMAFSSTPVLSSSHDYIHITQICITFKTLHTLPPTYHLLWHLAKSFHHISHLSWPLHLHPPFLHISSPDYAPWPVTGVT